MTGIDPKTAWLPFEPSKANPWSTRLAAHLFRRATFGGSVASIRTARDEGLAATLDGLFDAGNVDAFEQEMATAGRLTATGNDSRALASWWMLRMIQSPFPLQEKMTLFWHGHFATGADKVMDARAMLKQNNLIRKDCLGHFEALVKNLSRDVAMLIYLDSEDNRKTRPNENYARELMELFCLGPGNYTEQDIKEVARCFTGWEVKRRKFNFNAYQHDDKPKTFLGSTGEYDGDQAVDVIMAKPACARFLAKKLIRFFVFDEAPISDELAEPIAEKLRATDFDMAAPVRMILESNVFYSDYAIGKKIKSPVELAIGFLKFFGASTNMNRLGRNLQTLGQLPLYPPNVKGWDGGKQWINASTVLARSNLITALVRGDISEYQDGSLSQWAEQNKIAGEDWAEEFLLAHPLSESSRKQLNRDGVELAEFVTALAALPEFQLN